MWNESETYSLSLSQFEPEIMIITSKNKKKCDSRWINILNDQWGDHYGLSILFYHIIGEKLMNCSLDGRLVIDLHTKTRMADPFVISQAQNTECLLTLQPNMIDLRQIIIMIIMRCNAEEWIWIRMWCPYIYTCIIAILRMIYSILEIRRLLLAFFRYWILNSLLFPVVVDVSTGVCLALDIQLSSLIYGHRTAHTPMACICVCVHALSWVRMKERQRKKNVSQWVPCQWLMAYRRLMNWIEYYYHIWVSCEYGLLWKWKSWINHEHLFHIFYSSFLYLYAHT